MSVHLVCGNHKGNSLVPSLEWHCTNKKMVEETTLQGKDVFQGLELTNFTHLADLKGGKALIFI